MKRGKRRKADSTPEEWAAYLEKVRQYRLDNLEAYKARIREYVQRPEVKARRRLADNVEYRREKRRVRGRTPEAKAKKKAFAASNPQYRAKRNAFSRSFRTGFTQKLVDALLQTQENKCAVCGREFDSNIKGLKMTADHCHLLLEPRGLLCRTCNWIEGGVKAVGLAPEEFGKRLAAYLNNPPAMVFLLLKDPLLST